MADSDRSDLSPSEFSTVQQQAHAAVQAHGLKLSVIIPVFNNGEHLRTRAFPSLVKSPHFQQMHILLIDDGSTYRQTQEAVTELASSHPNVTAFLHAPGGSGSASRPRNTGLQLSFTDYVGYLDPDDEIHGSGPWLLAQRLEETAAAQFAIGEELRITDEGSKQISQAKKYAPLLGEDGLHHIDATALRRIGFLPASIEATVYRTQWLKAQQLEQVPGAAGQDSLFFLQAMHAADTFLMVDQPVYTYYANVPGSMVNAIDAGYFRKALIREKAQVQWLQEAGLFEDFMEYRFEHFFVTWYLKKLKLVPKQQRRESAQLLREIAAVYVGSPPSRHSWGHPPAMAFFRSPGVPSEEGFELWTRPLRQKLHRAKHAAKNRAGRTLRK